MEQTVGYGGVSLMSHRSRRTLGGAFNLKYQRKRERKKKEKKRHKLEAQNAIKNYKGSM